MTTTLGSNRLLSRMTGLVGMHSSLEEMWFWGVLMPVVSWVGRVVGEQMRMAVTSWTLATTTPLGKKGNYVMHAFETSLLIRVISVAYSSDILDSTSDGYHYDF